MAFTDSAYRGAMLVMLNGEDQRLAPRVECGWCKRPLLRIFFTARVRQIDPAIVSPGSAHRDVCITRHWKGPIPCPKAVEAADLIDRLMEASRR